MSAPDKIEYARTTDGRLCIALPDGIPADQLKPLLGFMRDVTSDAQLLEANTGSLLLSAIMGSFPSLSEFHRWQVENETHDAETAAHVADRVRERRESLGIADDDNDSEPIDFTADAAPRNWKRPEGDTDLSALVLDDEFTEEARALYIERGGDPEARPGQFLGAFLHGAVVSPARVA